MKQFENFGKAFKKVRTSNELTQAGMAKLIGVHPQFISNVERGLCCLPKPAIKKAVTNFKCQRSLKQAVRKDNKLNGLIAADQLFT